MLTKPPPISWWESNSASLHQTQGASLVETAEGGEAGRGKGNAEHIAVFRMVSVRTSILEDLDTYPAIAARTRPTLSTAKSPFGSSRMRV